MDHQLLIHYPTGLFLLMVGALPERDSHRLCSGHGGSMPAGYNSILSGLLPWLLSASIRFHDLFLVASRAVLAAGAETTAL